MNWNIVVVLIGLFSLALSCTNTDNSGNVSDSTGSQSGASATNSEDPQGSGSGSASGGGGNATLTIGDETWTFGNIYCAFSSEETRNERVSFSMGGFGESTEGVRIQFDVGIQDPNLEGRYEGEDVIHYMSLNDVEDYVNPSLAWESYATTIDIDGKSISGNGEFDDGLTDVELESIPGTLEATCP